MAIQDFRGDALFSTWLYRTAVHQAMNRRKRLAVNRSGSGARSARRSPSPRTGPRARGRAERGPLSSRHPPHVAYQGKGGRIGESLLQGERARRAQRRDASSRRGERRSGQRQTALPVGPPEVRIQPIQGGVDPDRRDHFRITAPLPPSGAKPSSSMSIELTFLFEKSKDPGASNAPPPN